ETLELNGLKLSDRGLKRLADVKSLRTLSLADVPVTDACVSALEGLKLAVLDLSGSKVTGEKLGSFKDVEELLLARSAATDAGVKAIKDLPKLRVLKLGFTEVTNAALDSVKDMKKLEDLDIYRTKVTGAGLEKLEGVLWLKRLVVAESDDLPAADVDKLQKALPKCKIER